MAAGMGADAGAEEDMVVLAGREDFATFMGAAGVGAAGVVVAGLTIGVLAVEAGVV
jgi:hypothetical protein